MMKLTILGPDSFKPQVLMFFPMLYCYKIICFRQQEQKSEKIFGNGIAPLPPLRVTS